MGGPAEAKNETADQDGDTHSINHSENPVEWIAQQLFHVLPGAEAEQQFVLERPRVVGIRFYQGIDRLEAFICYFFHFSLLLCLGRVLSICLFPG